MWAPFSDPFDRDRRDRGARPSRSGLRWHDPALTPGEARQIVSEVCERDLRSGAGEPDGAYDEAHPHLDRGEHVLLTLLRTRARVALPRAMCGGIGRPRGFARWNCAASPRFSSNARFACPRYAVSAQTSLAVLAGSSTAASWLPSCRAAWRNGEAADEAGIEKVFGPMDKLVPSRLS